MGIKMKIRFIAYGTLLFASICIFFLGQLNHKSTQDILQTNNASQEIEEEPEEDYTIKLPPVSAERMEELINQQEKENSIDIDNEKEIFQRHLFNIQNIAFLSIILFFLLTNLFIEKNADETKTQPKEESELIEKEGYHLLSQNIDEKIINV